MVNQTIRCNVQGCRYNEDDEVCVLSTITVGNDLTSSVGGASYKEETVCDSFEPRELL